MNIDLMGKKALVTGGNTGIGRAVSLALARCGADIAFTYYQHGDEAEQTRTDILALGRQAFAYALDVTDSAQVKTVVAQAAAALGGRLDILVNNAGSLVKRVPLLEMSDELWRQVLNLNLTSVFYVTRSVAPYLNNGGRVVNMSSLAGHNGGGAGAYATAKGGLITLTRGFAKELAPRNITVNAVAPGLILGTWFHKTFSSPEVIKAQTAGIALGRPGAPEEVAGAVLYYVSDLGAFVTGDVTDVNGGSWFA
jgi:3-oxoacyl-[acyl-carrier protein] reductase